MQSRRLWDRLGGPSSLAVAALATSAVAQPLPIIGPPVRLDVGGETAAANETTVAASDAAPDIVIAGWNDWRMTNVSGEIIRTAFALSTDAGVSWNDFFVRPPVPNRSTVEGDPMSAYDPASGTLWAGGISFAAGPASGIYVARKDPHDADFQPAVMARVGGGTDKPWMAAGPAPDGGSTNVYIAYNEGVLTSVDMGATWTGPVSLGAGVGFFPRVAADGTLYVSYWSGLDAFRIARSTDGGQTFEDRLIALRMDVWGAQNGSRFPGTFRVPPLPSFDVGPDGALYAVFFDTTSSSGGNDNVDIYFTRSVDRGDTWTTPVIMSSDGNSTPGDQFFSVLDVDPAGRLHLVYLDTRHNPEIDDDAVDGRFDAYYASSVNAGATWKEFRLTAASWSSQADGLDRPDQFLGDYLGLVVAGNRAYPAYPDTSAGDPDIYTNVIDLPRRGDVDGDGVISFSDLVGVLAAWGPCACCPEDLDGDGTVGFADLLLVVSNWG